MRGRPAKVCSQVEIRSHSVDTAPHQKQPPSHFQYGSQPQTHQMRLFCMHSLMEVDVMRNRTRNRVSVLLEAEVLQFWPNSVCTSRMGPAPIPKILSIPAQTSTFNSWSPRRTIKGVFCTFKPLKWEEKMGIWIFWNHFTCFTFLYRIFVWALKISIVKKVIFVGLNFPFFPTIFSHFLRFWPS